QRRSASLTQGRRTRTRRGQDGRQNRRRFDAFCTAPRSRPRPRPRPRPPAGDSMPFLERDDARIHWRVDGHPERPALVLVNSLGTDLSLWDPVMPGLLRRFQVLRLDKRGHGASEASPGDYTIELLASDVLAAMDAAGIERAHY